MSNPLKRPYFPQFLSLAHNRTLRFTNLTVLLIMSNSWRQKIKLLKEQNTSKRGEKMKNKLTTRQWRLYDCLLANFPNKLSLEEIYEQMREYYPPVTKAKTFVNSYARRMLTDDLTALELLDPIQLIIVRSSGGIGIASSKEEAEKYIETNKISLLEALKRYWRQKRKLNNHNQMKLVFNKEKDHCRAYIDKGEVNG